MSVDAQVDNHSIRWPRITRLRAGILAVALTASVAAVGVWSANASSTPVDAPVSAVDAQVPAIDQVTVAGFAKANALSGLSPASLRSFAEQPSLADYASANGLTGLSPASLAPTPTSTAP